MDIVSGAQFVVRGLLGGRENLSWVAKHGNNMRESLLTFQTFLFRCLSMLQKMPTSKKSLLLFRAISDTASDGQLGILAHVGIEIDLSNSNLAFLLRRIQNRSEPFSRT